MATEKRMIDVNEIKRYVKPRSDSTLRNMKKDELIAYIRILEHNCNVANSFVEQQAKNFGFLMKEKCDKCVMKHQQRLL